MTTQVTPAATGPSEAAILAGAMDWAQKQEGVTA